MRDDGLPEPFRDRSPEARAASVGRLLSEEDEVGTFRRQRVAESLGRPEQVGAFERRVRDEHGPVGPHGERLAQRIHRALWPHRDDHHFPFAGGLLELQRLLDGVRVEIRDGELDRPIESQSGSVEATARGRVRHCLHADGNLHGRDSSEIDSWINAYTATRAWR